jgi:hypothetical protein
MAFSPRAASGDPMKLGVSLAGLVFVLVAPSALAVHGEAYDAYGTATLANSVFTATVHWTGYNCYYGTGEPCDTFHVIIKQLTGEVVADETFHGGWTASGPVFYSTELLAYHAWAGDWSHVDSAHFDITGFQWQEVTNGGQDKALMYYTGNYYDYSLQLVVPYTVPVPF